MKHLIGLIVCLLLTAGTVLGTEAVQWQSDYAKALTAAKEIKRPLFVHFYGNNCPPCRAMDEEVFTNPILIQRLNTGFIPVKVNVAEQPALAKQMNITAIPTDVILNFDGQLIHRRQGGIKSDRFNQYLDFLAGQMKPAAPAVPANEPAAVLPAAVPLQSQPVKADNAVAGSPAAPNPQPPVDPFAFQQQTAPQKPVSPAAPVSPAVAAAAVSPNVDLPVNISAKDTGVALLDPFTKQPVAANSGAGYGIQEAGNTLSAAQSINPALPVPQPPVNLNGTDAITVEVPLALEGYCPILLNAEEKWIPGNPAFYTMYRGHIFRFSSEDAMSRFLQNPTKYVPMAMGEDIVLMVDRNKHIYGSRKFGAWYKDRVFLFSTQESLDAFAVKPDFYTDIALKYETAQKSIQRY
ncbi:MAG: thioredoxin family protein [Planctomycetaceae bacterium]|jgi:YHS domain-containing protein/thiol-disulfide isomerase/thioredoxin|nr:thioredoxin family protein [Planctomycetaceae bacterium]